MKKLFCSFFTVVCVLGCAIGFTACADNTPHTDIKADFSNTTWEYKLNSPIDEKISDATFNGFLASLNEFCGTTFSQDVTYGELLEWGYNNGKIAWNSYNFDVSDPWNYSAFKVWMDNKVRANSPKGNITIGSKSENKLTYNSVSYRIKQSNDHYVTFDILDTDSSFLGSFHIPGEQWVNGKYCNKDGYLYNEPKVECSIVKQDNEILPGSYILEIPFLLRADDGTGENPALTYNLDLWISFYWTMKT